MKNLKKVLAMVLAFACTFSMFAGAKVFEDVPAGSDYSEAITMLSDLGIIQGKDDGKYHPEDTITRAEACAMIARLMTGDPNVSQYVGAQSFTDVAKGSWKDSAIGYCYINGIVIGVGNNKFEPDRAITDAEFVTMVVRAMGYETADMKQNYPFSYMSNAQAIGLLDGTNMVASTDALRGEDAQVIYNALFTDYARGAKLVNTTHGTSVETYPTLAESVWGLERAAVGTWNKKDDEDATLSNCKAHTWVVLGADPTADGRIIAYPIDDDTTDIYTDGKGSTYSFKYDGDASAVAGYQVELWGEGNHGEPTWESKNDKYVWSEDWTIKAIKTVKGQKAYDYNASMADSKSENGEIVLGEETLDLDSVAANAKLYEQVYAVDQYVAKEYNKETIKADKDVEKALNVRDGAQYKLMDWDSDGDIDWVVASTANYYKVEAVNSKRLTVSAMKAGNEETSTDSDSKTWKLNDLTEIDKVKYDFKTEEDLEEGDIIEVTYSVAYDKGEKDEVVTATITKVEADTAELDKVSTKDTLELTFDGEVKKIAEANVWGDVVVPANPAKYEQFDDEELGTQFALWTNRNGFIVYSDYATDTSNYLMVLDTGDGSDKTGDRKQATMDVLYADNSVKKDVKVVTDLKLDGYDKDSREWTESEVVGNVYKYWMNEDGVITKMEPMIEDVATAQKGTDYTYDQSSDRLKEGGNFIASLEEAKVIFAVTQHSTDKPNYIIRDEDGSLYVDDADVLAVKQADIPDIGTDPEAVELVSNNTGTWLGTNNDIKYIADVDKNGEASAAILGVENFNKFNDASTKVGLVTSVSYDKNDVVTVDVAYNGKVESISSKEKVDFDDVVEQYNKTTKKDEGLTTKEAATMLKNNAAYAEITTDADGKLTNVTFMDVDGNNAVGHYYEVSRRIVSKVKSGNVAYGNQSYYYYNDKNLYSVGRLEVSDKDLDKDVQYYSIDGRPTVHDKDSYKGEMLSVANGFDGNPDITAESDSNLIDSYVNNKFDDADTYYVADLASKIDGDIVAVYAFEDSLGETDKESDSIFVTETKKPVQNNDQKSAIAEVKSAQGGGAVSATDLKVFKDGKEVSDVTLTLDGKDLNVQAKATAVPGDYVAKFTVGKTEYKVEFKVVAADVVVPTSDAKVEQAGIAKVDEQGAVTKITFGGTTVAAATKFAVELNGEKITVEMQADKNGPRYAATALANAITDKLIKGITATANEMSVTVTGEGTDVAVDFIPGNSKLTADIAVEKEYVAPVAAQKGKATLTITSGVDAATKLALAVDGKALDTATISAKASADEVAKALAEAASSSDRFDVTYNGNVITVEQKTAADAKMALTIVNKN